MSVYDCTIESELRQKLIENEKKLAVAAEKEKIR